MMKWRGNKFKELAPTRTVAIKYLKLVHVASHCRYILYKSKYKKVGKLLIWKVKSNVSSVQVQVHV